MSRIVDTPSSNAPRVDQLYLPSGPSPLNNNQTTHKLPSDFFADNVGAGLLPYGSVDLNGISWDELMSDISTTDTMAINYAEICAMMIKALAEMRTSQREAWVADAQNALALGLNAADRMRESAMAKFACDVINNGAAIIVAAVQLGVAIGSAARIAAITKTVTAQSNVMMQQNQTTPGGPSSLTPAETARLNMWKTQEIERLTTPVRIQGDITSRLGDAIGALMKLGGSSSEFFSALKQAEAHELRVLGEYTTTLAQVELDFANELRDVLKSYLDSMKSVENSRHQTMQGIYSI